MSGTTFCVSLLGGLPRAVANVHPGSLCETWKREICESRLANCRDQQAIVRCIHCGRRIARQDGGLTIRGVQAQV
jgi:hypothetical protein